MSTVSTGLHVNCIHRTSCQLYPQDFMPTVSAGLHANCIRRTSCRLYPQDFMPTVSTGLHANCIHRTSCQLYPQIEFITYRRHTALRPIGNSTTVDMKYAVFWVVKPCSLVQIYLRFGRYCSLRQRGWQTNDSSALMIKAAGFIVISVQFYQVPWCHIPGSYFMSEVAGTFLCASVFVTVASLCVLSESKER